MLMLLFCKPERAEKKAFCIDKARYDNKFSLNSDGVPLQSMPCNYGASILKEYI